MSTPARNTSHVANALAHLTDGFKGRPNIEAILSAFTEETQELENALQDVIEARLLDTATGAQLDILGALVGEERGGRGDTNYRAAIRLRIHVNRSHGTVDDIIRFGELTLASEIQYEEGDVAAFVLRLYDLEGAYEVSKLLKKARAAGVKASLEYTTADPSTYMRWGSTTTSTGFGGFGSVHDGTAGKIVGGAFST